MAKKVTFKNQFSLADYKNFVTKSYPKVLKNPDYYLKQYSHFKDLASAMPCAIYIIDYTSQKYIFVSESSKQITGYTSDEHMQMGQFDFYNTCMHKDDAKVFTSKVFMEFIESAKEISNDKIKNCRFSLNYRLKRKDGNIIKILQQSVVLESNDLGYPLISLGILTDITAHKSDDTMVLSVSSYSQETGFKTISSKSFSSKELNLTSREKEIIRHICFGHSSSKISELLNISILTVNAHRRNINKKTNCKNVAALINFAINNNIA